jgi:hypothetical protein
MCLICVEKDICFEKFAGAILTEKSHFLSKKENRIQH